MDDKDMLDFLAGIHYDGDDGIVSATGELVAVVAGGYHAGLSPDDVAALLISACHEYARFAEVIEAAKHAMQRLQDIIYYWLPMDAVPKEIDNATR